MFSDPESQLEIIIKSQLNTVLTLNTNVYT